MASRGGCGTWLDVRRWDSFLLGVLRLMPGNVIALVELCFIHLPSTLHDLRTGLVLLNKCVKHINK